MLRQLSVYYLLILNKKLWNALNCTEKKKNFWPVSAVTFLIRYVGYMRADMMSDNCLSLWRRCALWSRFVSFLLLVSLHLTARMTYVALYGCSVGKCFITLGVATAWDRQSIYLRICCKSKCFGQWSIIKDETVWILSIMYLMKESDTVSETLYLKQHCESKQSTSITRILHNELRIIC
jgi:hypothetical protein